MVRSIIKSTADAGKSEALTATFSIFQAKAMIQIIKSHAHQGLRCTDNVEWFFDDDALSSTDDNYQARYVRAVSSINITTHYVQHRHVVKTRGTVPLRYLD